MKQAHKNHWVSKQIFGSYIQNMRIVPGKKQTGYQEGEEKRLFEMVDEYVEES